MRTNNRITLVEKQGEWYNPETGNREEMPPKKTTIPATLSNLSIQKRNELFGNINVNIISAITRRPVTIPYDYVEINGKRYNFKAESNYRKGILYLEGDSIEN